MTSDEERERRETRRLGALAATLISLDEWIAQVWEADFERTLDPDIYPIIEGPDGSLTLDFSLIQRLPAHTAYTLAWLAMIIPADLRDVRLVQNARRWLVILRRHLARIGD